MRDDVTSSIIGVCAAPRTWPARLLGRGRAGRTWTEALDEWADLARDYMVSHPPASMGPNTLPVRTRER